MSKRRRIDVPTINKEITELRKEEWIDYAGDINIHCSNCDTLLVSLVVIRPNVPIHNEIVVECCHCGDKSFVQEVHGMFALGGTSNLSNMEITDQKERDGQIYMKVLIKTRK